MLASALARNLARDIFCKKILGGGETKGLYPEGKKTENNPIYCYKKMTRNESGETKWG